MISLTAAPPVIIKKTFETNEDTPLTDRITADDPAAIFSLVDGNQSVGKVELETDGNFTYTPASNYDVADSFQFSATVGSDTVIATATISINPINDAPYGASQKIRVQNDVAYEGRLTGYDFEHSPLKYYKQSDPLHGSVTLETYGVYVYKPSAGYVGPDSFTYYIRDGEVNSQPIEVEISVIPGSLADDVGIVGDEYFGNISIYDPRKDRSYSTLDFGNNASIVDIAIDQGGSRAYALTEDGKLKVLSFNWQDGNPSLTEIESLNHYGDLIALSLDARTAFIAKGSLVLAINLYEEGYRGKIRDEYERKVTFPVGNKIRAMCAHPDGERLIVACQEDTPKGNFLDLKGKYPITVFELPISKRYLSGPASIYIVEPECISSDQVTTGYVDITGMNITPDGNCALITVSGAQVQKATAYGIRPYPDEDSAGVIVVNLNGPGNAHVGKAEFLGVISSVVEGEDSKNILKKLGRETQKNIHPAISYISGKVATAQSAAEIAASGPAAQFVGLEKWNEYTSLLDELGHYLEAYKDYGQMQAYANNYPTDMIAPGGVGILSSGEHAIVSMEDTNNIGVLHLGFSDQPEGFTSATVSAAADKLSFPKDQSFYFEAASSKSINAVGFGESRENGEYEFLRMGEIFSTPGDDFALLGMSGGIPGRSTNKFGIADVPDLVEKSLYARNQTNAGYQQANTDNPYMGHPISPGFRLVEAGHSTPRQVATLPETDSDGDGVSNHIEAFNRWNSYRGITGDRVDSVVSLKEDNISIPTTYQEMHCDQQYFLPDSGLGYRFNHFYQTEFTMNLGSWSNVSTIERIGKQWHERFLKKQNGDVSRPYFQVSFMGSPKSAHLTNTKGIRLADQIRSGQEACFPYLAMGSDLAHDFVRSNDDFDKKLNNSMPNPDGFDAVNNAILLDMLLKDPSVIHVHLDPLALKEMAEINDSLSKHPKIQVVGIEDQNVESRRSLDSFMLVEFLCATPIDLDVDSNNNGGTLGIEGSSEEEALENPSELGASFAAKHYGKILQVNNADRDQDGIPDYADGTNSSNAQGSETQNLTAVFVKFPPENTLPPEITDVVVRFTYDASDPGLVTGPDYGLPEDGSLRLWLGDGGQPAKPKMVRNVSDIWAGGDWVKNGVWYSKDDLGVSGDAVTLFIESVKESSSPADQQLKVELTYIQANGDYIALGSDTVAFTSNGISLVPDYNRDGKIDGEDKGKWYAGEKFYFWTNTDNDDGAAKGDDFPNQRIEPASFLRRIIGNVQYADAFTRSNDLGTVSGLRDLIDYFPVHIDVGTLFDVLDISKVRIKVRDADVNFVLPNSATGALDPGDSDSYLRDVETARKFESIEKTRVGSEKQLTYSNDPSKASVFLEYVKEGKGVFLLEGRVPFEGKLVLEVLYNEKVIATTGIDLKISEVEDMYRWVNLRHVTEGDEDLPTDMIEMNDGPSGYPDSITNGKQLLFVHGFNVTERTARGWCGEYFKRMWWSGSNAMFTGITWEGNERPGLLPQGAYYHSDVINAFQAAPEFTRLIEDRVIPGSEFTVAAHSLGNMLVSSAIVDHELDIYKYFMIDAAVAKQAYEPESEDIEQLKIRNEDEWVINYDPQDSLTSDRRLWSSGWYSLFAPNHPFLIKDLGPPPPEGKQKPNDGRFYLRWKGRFGPIDNAINYYSSGEDVLSNNPEGKAIWNPMARVRVWMMQEKVKGSFVPAFQWGTNSHGGWSFNSHYFDNDGFLATDEIAKNIRLDELKIEPFFKPFEAPKGNKGYHKDILYDPLKGSEAAYNLEVRAHILAEAIPSTSLAAGRNEFDLRDTVEESIDMMTNFKTFDDNQKPQWPTKEEKKDAGEFPDQNQWTHSDFILVGYPFVWGLYDNMVKKGGLK